MKEDKIRIERNRQTARETKRVELMTWYLENSNGIPPDNQCEDAKAYRGKVLWWLEPPIPNVTNPLLIEEFIGDGWSLRVEPL